MPPALESSSARTPEQLVDERLAAVPSYQAVALNHSIDTLVSAHEKQLNRLRAAITQALEAYIKKAALPPARRGRADMVLLKQAADNTVSTYYSEIEALKRSLLDAFAAEERRDLKVVLDSLGEKNGSSVEQAMVSCLSATDIRIIRVEEALDRLVNAHKQLIRSELLSIHHDTHSSIVDTEKLDSDLIPVDQPDNTPDVALNTLKQKGIFFGSTTRLKFIDAARDFLIQREAQQANALRMGQVMIRLQPAVGPALVNFFNSPQAPNGEQRTLLTAMANAAMDSMETPPADRERIAFDLSLPDFTSRRLLELKRIEDALSEYGRVPKLSSSARARKEQLEVQKKEVLVLLAREYGAWLAKQFKNKIRPSLPDGVEAVEKVASYVEGEMNAQIDVKRNNDFAPLVRFRMSALLDLLPKRAPKAPAAPKPPRAPLSQRTKLAVGAALAVVGVSAFYGLTERDFVNDGEAVGMWAADGVAALTPDMSWSDFLPKQEETVEAPTSVAVEAAPAAPVSQYNWMRLAEGLYPAEAKYGADVEWLQRVAAIEGISDPNTLWMIAVHCEGGVNAAGSGKRAMEYNLPQDLINGFGGSLPWVTPGQQVAGYKAFNSSVAKVCSDVGTADMAIRLEPLAQ